MPVARAGNLIHAQQVWHRRWALLGICALLTGLLMICMLGAARLCPAAGCHALPCLPGACNGELSLSLSLHGSIPSILQQVSPFHISCSAEASNTHSMQSGLKACMQVRYSDRFVEDLHLPVEVLSFTDVAPAVSPSLSSGQASPRCPAPAATLATATASEPEVPAPLCCAMCIITFLSFRDDMSEFLACGLYEASLAAASDVHT